MGARTDFFFEATRRREIDQRTSEQVLEKAKDIYASYLGTSFKYATPATVIFEKPISIGKYPGIEFEMQHDNLRYLGRFYAVDRRVYSLTVGTQTQVPFPEEMQRWYNSFRLIEPKEQSKRCSLHSAAITTITFSYPSQCRALLGIRLRDPW